ncbi:hypothetical protein [Mariniflexile sp. HMF6888]|uniref:hypothetical protein n=1 Tax=Mariniflexile sp. HMF6888 TaxID=3373086 RepID=UPI0037B87426
MESPKERHARLESMLKKSEEDLELSKEALKAENKKLKDAKERTKQLGIKYFGFDIEEEEDRLSKNVLEIIN